MSKWLKKAKAPEGFSYVEPVLDALDDELRERMNEPHENQRKCESIWPVHQINWQKTRYIYDLYYKHNQRISKEVYDYCIKMKFVDANLIAKWKKPGYERLCSTYAINSKNFNFGSVSICRVPKHSLSDDSQVVETQFNGCHGCSSGDGGNIFGNKYGQYLADIQIARELKQQKREQLESESSTSKSVWATEEEETKRSSDQENDDDDDDAEEEEEEKDSACDEPDEPQSKKARVE